MLMQHGAESALVESMTKRVGKALGADATEIALMASAVTITTRYGGDCITTVRKVEDRGINMHLVISVQRAVLDLERGLIDTTHFIEAIYVITPFRYPKWLTALAIGTACACFARLAHADWLACSTTFVASTLAMIVRLQLASRHFNPLVNFFITAFVASSIAAQGCIYGIGSTPQVAMAACVLMLVPGYPMINAISDMVKGYINTGIARATMATMLSSATCLGIMLAANLWNVWGWK